MEIVQEKSESFERISRCVDNVFQDIYETLQDCVDYFVTDFSMTIDFKSYEFTKSMYIDAVAIIEDKLYKDGCLYSIEKDEENLEATVNIPIVTLNDEQENFWKKNDDNYHKIINKQMKMITVNSLGIGFIISSVMSLVLIGSMLFEQGNINLVYVLFAISIALMILSFSVIGFINKNLEKQENENIEEIRNYYKEQKIEILVPEMYYNGQLIKKKAG